MELAKKTAKNSIFSTISFLWPLALAFFATPFIVGKLGQNYYGIFALLSTFVGFLGFLDFGVAPSIVKYVSELETNKNYEDLSEILSSAVFFYFIIGAIGFLIIAFGSPYYIHSALRSTDISFDLVYKLFLISGFGFLINMLLSAFSAVPSALQRYDISSKISLFISTILTLGNVSLLIMGFGITAIVIYMTFVSIISLSIYLIINKKLLPQIRYFTLPTKKSFKSIFHFGGFAFIASISGLVIAELDRLILGAYLGPSAVTYYVIPGSLTIKILALVNAISAVVFPLSASLIARNATAELHKLYKRSFRLVILALIFISIPGLAYANKFLFYWLGPDFSANSTVAFWILIMTYAISALHVVPFLLAFGSNKPKYSAIYAMVTAILNVTFMYLFIPRWGINGAAAAYLVAVCLTTPVFVWFVQKKLLNKDELKGYWARIVKSSAIISILLGLMSYVSSMYIKNILEMALCYILISGIVFYIAIKFGLIDKEDTDLFYRIIGGTKISKYNPKNKERNKK